MSAFNILSLDGGGTWAIIEVMALGELYGMNTPGHQILKNYRLVVANSGGAIVAAGLFANMTPQQLFDEFSRDHLRTQVFFRRPFYRRATRMIGLGPKYRTGRKLDALQRILDRYEHGIAATTLENLKTQFGRPDDHHTDLVVIGFDYDTNRAKFFRTNRGSRAGTQKDQPETTTTLAEAVHASTNAPVNYFDAPAVINYSGAKLRMWDGAIAGYNNPILAGITEALANGVARTDIRVLSIGTGARFLPRAGAREAEHPWLLARPFPRRLFYVVDDIRKLAMSIIENPPDVATYMAYLMIGEALPPAESSLNDPRRGMTRIVRLNPLMQPTINPATRKFDTPGAGTRFEEDMHDRDFARLLRLDMDAVRDSEIDVITRFARLWLKDQVYNQPILAGASSLDCEIGHRWFSAARERAGEIGLI